MKIKVCIIHENKILVKIFIFLNYLKIIIGMTTKNYKCENTLVFNKEEQRGAMLFIARHFT